MVTKAQQSDFIDRMSEPAKVASQLTGISVETIMGQWAMESEWGTAKSATGTHNLGGIEKGSWKGPLSSTGKYRSYKDDLAFAKNWSEIYATKEAVKSLTKSGKLGQPKAEALAFNGVYGFPVGGPKYSDRINSARESVMRFENAKEIAHQARVEQIGFNDRLGQVNFGGYLTDLSPNLMSPQQQAAGVWADRFGQAAPPSYSLTDLAPDVTQPPAPDWDRSMVDRPGQTRGPATDPYGFSNIRDAGFISHTGDLTGLFGDPTTTGAITAQGYPGITSFGPNQFTEAPRAEPSFNTAGSYDWGNPISAGNVPGAWDTPRTEFDRTGGLPSLGDLDPLAAGREAFPSAGYDPLQSAREAFPTSPLEGLSPIGIGAVGPGITATADRQAGRPSTAGMSFGDMTKGITGYQTTTTTPQIPNPAYEAWQEAFNNPRATPQQMYADEWSDKIGMQRGSFVSPLASLGPPPSRTIAGPPVTTRSPVYGTPLADLPRGTAVGATLTAQPMWNDRMTQQMLANNLAINQFGQYGLQGFTGSFNTGLTYDGGAAGNTSASAGGFSGGFGDARGGGYDSSTGAPLGGSENQGGAQGSDPSGRGGLY